MITTIEKARKLLIEANVFHEPDDDLDSSQLLNMNDVWSWGSASCEEVADEELVEVANLFWSYGWAGILYWVSKKNGGMRSEFYDNNRFIEFVEHEETLVKKVPASSIRAYKKIKYTLRGKRQKGRGEV